MRKTVSIVAHIDHGKTTLIDSLLIPTRAICRQSAGELRYLDTRIDEQSRGITLKLSCINLKDYTIIDTPGHVDFESLVQASAILADGFIMLVDVSEDISPRLLAITRYINHNTVLVLNKIDRIENNLCAELQGVIERVNALMQCDLFSWEKNNIIIAWSTSCFGVSKKMMDKVTKKNTLRNAVRFYEELRKKIITKDVLKIRENFHIKGKSDKDILMGVMPLWECIFGCIDDLESKISSTALAGVTTYCILEKKGLQRENLLFVTKILSGTIKKGDKVISRSGDHESGYKTKECIIEQIYEFGINTKQEIDEVVGPSLVLIRSDFLRHSIIYAENTQGFIDNELKVKGVQLKPKPFYTTKIILKDNNKILFKEALQTISFLESIFKAKINKFGEYEIFCEGRVHFEKICNDLKDDNFDIEICESKKRFCESVTKTAELCEISGFENLISIIVSDNIENKLQFDDIDSCSEIPESIDIFKKIMNKRTENMLCKIFDDGKFNITNPPTLETIELEPSKLTFIRETNILVYYDNKHKEIVKNVFEYFISTGWLIQEEIKFTKICILISSHLKVPDIFPFIKSHLITCYTRACPIIMPSFYRSRIQILPEYLGSTYKILHKHNFIVENETFEAKTNFYNLIFLVPEFQYYAFVDEIRTKTKGTVYIEFDELGFINDKRDAYNKLVNELRKEKGMFVEEKIVENPEKQRTRKK